MDWSRCGQSLKTMWAVMVRRCSKKRYRAPRAAMAVRQARTQIWETVWKAKASRLRVTRTLARVFLPWPWFDKLTMRAMLEVVSVGLEDVEGLVLDLPAGTAAGGELGDGLGGDRQVGDEAVVVGSLSLGVEDLDGEPIDAEGILAGAQRHAGEPAVDVGGALAWLADGLAMLFEIGAGEILGDGLMR